MARHHGVLEGLAAFAWRARPIVGECGRSELGESCLSRVDLKDVEQSM